MNLARLNDLVERLRKHAIGAPKMIEEKQAFEYREQSVKTVAVLKLIRAAHGVSALEVLCGNGFFIDAGVIMRCVGDCSDEIFFLLEDYPKSSRHVDEFVRVFYLDDDSPTVPKNKIRSATVRILKGAHDDATQKLMERIYVTFCGYVHANYAHVMEVYNGADDSYNLAGVPSERMRAELMQYVDVAGESVLHAAAFIAQKLELKDLHGEIVAAFA